MIRVLVVCLGNICRSPTGEAVLRSKLHAAGLAAQVEVDSAGTATGHIGLPPDERSQRHARRRGYDLAALRARRIDESDFHRFDLILAMDDQNLADLEELAPAGSKARLQRFATMEVPDPYLRGAPVFEQVLDIVEAASDEWVLWLDQRVGTL
jgi:protein-tyrosine phosphatase